jgi:hypothetical protein
MKRLVFTPQHPVNCIALKQASVGIRWRISGQSARCFMGSQWLLFVGFAALVLAYAIYGIEQRRGLIEPNRASWMIWSAANLTEALTYNALNAGAAQNIIFFTSSIACLAITLSVWRHGAFKRPTRLEIASLSACLAALVLWLGFQNSAWAHWLLVVMVPVSFLPTFASVLKDRANERSAAWGLWTVSDLAILSYVLSVSRGQGTDVPYVLVELACHAAVWGMIGFATINPFRSLVWRRGQVLVRVDGPEEPGAPGSAPRFLIGRNRLGKAIYSGKALEAGQTVIRFEGPMVPRERVPAKLVAEADRYVQVGPGQFMGPSGGVDDLINHSCDPNCGLKFDANGPVLVTLRAIAEGEELTWDYSTTIVADDWSMDCACGTALCRGRVGDFRDLPPATKARYQWLGVVPAYVCEADREAATPLSEAG